MPMHDDLIFEANFQRAILDSLRSAPQPSSNSGAGRRFISGVSSSNLGRGSVSTQNQSRQASGGPLARERILSVPEQDIFRTRGPRASSDQSLLTPDTRRSVARPGPPTVSKTLQNSPSVISEAYASESGRTRSRAPEQSSSSSVAAIRPLVSRHVTANEHANNSGRVPPNNTVSAPHGSSRQPGIKQASSSTHQQQSLRGRSSSTSVNRQSQQPTASAIVRQGSSHSAGSITVRNSSSEPSGNTSGDVELSDLDIKSIGSPADISRDCGSDLSFTELICQTMLIRTTSDSEQKNAITFEQIASLEDAKRLLTEAVLLPMMIPDIFKGIREPWKGVLLYGPPGTGKTLLAKAIATVGKCIFFNVSSASLLSKYLGESEKIVANLFRVARHLAPSIIFIDEIDAIASSRGNANEHEASRRVKSELLSQLDGVPSMTQSDHGPVMVLATTNKPWDLDEAIRRRFEKRVYIPLPDSHSRLELFRIHLCGVRLTWDSTWDESDSVLNCLVQKTEGYSGADIHLICREASMMPVRRILSNKNPSEVLIMKQQGSLLEQQIVVSPEDFDEALKRTQPSVGPNEVQDYVNWSQQYSSC